MNTKIIQLTPEVETKVPDQDLWGSKTVYAKELRLDAGGRVQIGVFTYCPGTDAHIGSCVPLSLSELRALKEHLDEAIQHAEARGQSHK